MAVPSKAPTPRVALLIPAYQPTSRLEGLVREILRLDTGGLIASIVVVDDGSDAPCGTVFYGVAGLPNVTVLRHAANLGKGAALKTGFNHILVSPDALAGIVTADADGQHAPADVLKVAARLAEAPKRLILGTREFAPEVPLRSRVGNILTRWVFGIFTGRFLRDTQTGLRGWPIALCRECLSIPIQGYDFELEALVNSRDTVTEEIPIQTIYQDGNRGSHFNPLRDSIKVYFVFARYCGSSLIAACVDTAAFSAVYANTGRLGLSQICGRAVSVCVAFMIVKSLVFRSDVTPLVALARYIALVALSGSLSYGLIELIRDQAHLPVLIAKLLAEGLLFVGNFAIQRQFIFTKRTAV